jgi:hypothetical protein
MKITHASFRKKKPTEGPSFQERFLIITADDFGASTNINEGIKIAADKKAITSISVLSNFIASLPYLKNISQNHPWISIGVHLNITTGKPILAAEKIPSLVSADGNFYPIETLLLKIKSVSADDLRKELRAQILALANHDIRLEHLSDQFGILSFYGPFFNIIIELAKEFNVPVRTPLIASVKYPELFRNSQIQKRGRQIALRLALKAPLKAITLLQYSRIHEMEKKAQKLDNHGIVHPDLLIECFWGDPTPSNFLHILEHLPSGTSEVVLHLGTIASQESYPSGLDLDYFKNRENELITVTSDYLQEYYKFLNIRTIGFSEISKYTNK